MDFLTLFPYIGILVLVVINAILVINRDITVDESDHKPEH
jgi:hypothetical protein